MKFYKRYMGDYARDTKHLTMLQHGAYTLLLDAYYATKKPLPKEENIIFRIVSAQKRSEKESVSLILKEFWELTNEGWINARAAKEISESIEKSENNRKSANKRWNANAMQTHSKRNANAVRRARVPEPEPDKTLKPLSSDGTDDSKVLLDSAFEIWHRIAAEFKLPMVAKQSQARKKKLLRILKNHGGIEAWAFACGKIRASAHLQGHNDRGWRANFDFMTQESSFIKVTEGVYDGNGIPNRPVKPENQAQHFQTADEVFESWGVGNEKHR